MRITLINVSSVLTSDGSRLISALLKRAGHQVNLVFLARSEPLNYEPFEFEPLEALLKNTDLAMIAVYSNYAVRAIQVTEYIHKKFPGMKVIWGGPHCIAAAEQSLRYADGVCFSEADFIITDLVNKIESGADYLHTPNMAFLVNGSTIINDVLPPYSDLDGLPYYDYDLDTHFLLNNGLFNMTREAFKERCVAYPLYVPSFFFITSRGCIENCSYCNNCRYVKMFGQNRMRYHSIDRIIAELNHTIPQFGFFEFVAFGDDNFLMRPSEQLEDFAHKYKKNIGLPFAVCVSAKSYSEKKIRILLDAGLKVVQMGVQSGSQRVIDDVYQRRISVSKTQKIVREMEPCLKERRMVVLLDFIIDNPYENKNDIMKSYRYLIDLPKQVRINLFILSFFPGTPIYDWALRDGFIQPFDEKTFKFYKKSAITYQVNYEMILIFIASLLQHDQQLSKYFPNIFLHALGSTPLRAVASLFPKRFYAMLIRRLQLYFQKTTTKLFMTSKDI